MPSMCVAGLIAMLSLIVLAPREDDQRAAPPPQLVERASIFKPPFRRAPSMSGDGAHLGWLECTPAGVATLVTQRLDANGLVGVKGPRIAPREDAGAVAGVGVVAWWFVGDRSRRTTHVAALVDLGAGRRALVARSLDDPDEPERTLVESAKAGLEVVLVEPRQQYDVLAFVPTDDGRALMRFDVRNGESRTVARFPDAEGRVRNVGVDGGWHVALVERERPDGTVHLEQAINGRFETIATWPPDVARASRIVSVRPDGTSAWIVDAGHPLADDTGALYSIDLRDPSRRWTILATDDRAELSTMLLDPETREPELVLATWLRNEWRAMHERYEEEIALLRRREAGDFSIVARNDADSVWLIESIGDRTRPGWSLLRRSDRAVLPLFGELPDGVGPPLRATGWWSIATSDGVRLPYYRTLPDGKRLDDRRPMPLVVVVADGQPERLRWRFDPWHQWFADRGAVVLTVQPRGVHGFGRALARGADRIAVEGWTQRMVQDVFDVIGNEIDERIADPSRIAVIGLGSGAAGALGMLAAEPNFLRAIAVVGRPSCGFARAIPKEVGSAPVPLLVLDEGDQGDAGGDATADLLALPGPCTILRWPGQAAWPGADPARDEAGAILERWIAEHIGLRSDERVPTAAGMEVVATDGVAPIALPSQTLQKAQP